MAKRRQMSAFDEDTAAAAALEQEAAAQQAREDAAEMQRQAELDSRYPWRPAARNIWEAAQTELQRAAAQRAEEQRRRDAAQMRERLQTWHLGMLFRPFRR